MVLKFDVFLIKCTKFQTDWLITWLTIVVSFSFPYWISYRNACNAVISYSPDFYLFVCYSFVWVSQRVDVGMGIDLTTSCKNIVKKSGIIHDNTLSYIFKLRNRPLSVLYL